MTFRHYLRCCRKSFQKNHFAQPLRKHSPRLHLENLEDRSLPSVSIVGPTGGLFNVIANGGSGADNYTVRLNSAGTMLEIFENSPTMGNPTLSISKSAVNQLSVNGNGGDDTLTVEFSNGNPVPSGDLFYQGGSSTDRLKLQGGSFSSETHTITGATSGTINLTSRLARFGTSPTINYSTVESINDTVALTGFLPSQTPTLTFNATSAADTINIENGPVVNGLQTAQLDSSGATLNFANKPHVSINTLGGMDVVTLNNSVAAAGLDGVTLDTGTEIDTITVARTLAGIPVTVDAGAGKDTINVGTGHLDYLKGAVTVNGQDNQDVVNVQDQASGYNGTYTIIGSALYRTSFGGLTFDTVENLVLNAASGSNAIYVLSLPADAFLYIYGDGGSDTLVGPNLANTWTLSGSNSGSLDGRVSFSGVENLTGGIEQDKFRFLSGGSIAGKMEGGVDGGDWLDYSALSTGVTVNLTTGAASCVGGSVRGIENVRGGAGDDDLTGDAGNNILLGRAGIDHLHGGLGQDILIGGFGADVLTSDGGEDILIGGDLLSDTSDALMAEWGRTDLDFDGRVAHLLNGGGYNGTVILDPSALTSDGAADSLTDGTDDRVWFLAQPQDEINGFTYNSDRLN